MTNAEWAAWVQAIFSIVAIVGAAGIAIWQSRIQHNNSLRLMHTEQRLARIEVARSLLSLSTNSLKVIKHLASQLHSREAVYNVAEGITHMDLNQLRVIEGAVHSIPLYSLPHQLVTLTMMVSSTLRQFREHVETVLRVHRNMDAAQFEDFFSNLSKMQKSLKLTCDDIQAEVEKTENEN